MKAIGAVDFVKQKLNELELHINKEKTGVYKAISRKILGFEFYRQSKNSEVLIKRCETERNDYFRNWHGSVIQRIDKNYHIVNNGILTRKDYTVLFENEEKKCYLPVETCGMLNVYSNVSFSSGFFEFAKQKGLKVSLYDKFGTYVGSFVSVNHFLSTKTLLKQVMIYNDKEKRLAIAKKIELASLHNQRENLRYTQKHRPSNELEDIIGFMSNIMSQMKVSKTIEELMLLEARAKQKYLHAFDLMIINNEFRFVQRTKRPPKNEVNAMISFGNVFLYRRIACEIYKSSLDIRIGFVHAANNRSESLNLDLAEIFKPIIVDKVIFSVINKGQILKEQHFEKTEEGGVWLNKEGKRIFIHELEDKLYQKITIDGKKMTYDALIRNEVYKIYHTVAEEVKYKAYKYT